MLGLESADMLDRLHPQLQYAGYSYKQLIQRLYDGLPMSTGIDFYMAAARHFIWHPVMVIKPQFNLNKEKYGNVQFIFEKEYFCEADKNMNDDEIHLKFVFNGINYYVPFMQADAAKIIRTGAPILRNVVSTCDNMRALMQNIPTHASINSGLKKLEMHLKAAADIVKTTHLNAGYSHAAETASIVIPGVNPLQEGTVRRRKVACNVAHKKTQTGEEEESQTPTTETQHQPDPESQPLSTDGQTTTAAQPTTQQSAGASTSAAAAKPQANFDSTYMKPNQCVCGFEAKDQHDLRVHKGYQHPNKSYMCWGQLQNSQGKKRRCPFDSNDEGIMWRHYRTQHLGLFYRKCNVPGCTSGRDGGPYRADAELQVQKYMAEVHGSKTMMRCPHCEKYVAGVKYKLERHMQACKMRDKKVKFYTCEKCRKGFRDHDQFVRHMGQQHPAVPSDTSAWYFCSDCGKKFSSSSACSRHVKEKHAPEGSKTG